MKNEFESLVFESFEKVCRKHNMISPTYIAKYLLRHGATIQRWTRCSKRLPDKEGRYMVVFSYEDLEGHKHWVNKIAFFSHCLKEIDEYNMPNRPGWYVSSFDFTPMECHGVTHWMHLPEPPKDGE